MTRPTREEEIAWAREVAERKQAERDEELLRLRGELVNALERSGMHAADALVSALEEFLDARTRP